MMEIMERSEGRVVGIRASGKLTVDDYERVLGPRLEEMAHEFGGGLRALAAGAPANAASPRP